MSNIENRKKYLHINPDGEPDDGISCRETNRITVQVILGDEEVGVDVYNNLEQGYEGLLGSIQKSYWDMDLEVRSTRKEEPCYREEGDDGEWTCVNDHTGCLYNNGHNLCGHEGSSDQPLEDKDNG